MIILAAKISLVRDNNSPLFSSYHRGYEGALKGANRVCVAQEKDKQLIVNRHKSLKGKTSVLPKIVDSELLALVPQKTTEVITKYSLDSFIRGHEKIVGCIGRIDEEKNVEFCIEDIWPLVKSIEPNAGLLIVGGGKQLRSLKKKYNQKDILFLDEELTNLEILCILNVIDVLAFPSGIDYTPRIPLEALCVGTEVVLNDLNFNDIYKPFSHAVPVQEYKTYSPYGYNDSTKLLPNANNQKGYGIPDVRAFAEMIIAAFTFKKAHTFPKDMHTTGGFMGKFQKLIAPL